MSTQIRAVFENGVFRPLETVQLPERHEVTVTIDGPGAEFSGSTQVLFELPAERWQAFCDAMDAAPREIPALRKLLTEASLFDDAHVPSKTGPA